MLIGARITRLVFERYNVTNVQGRRDVLWKTAIYQDQCETG